MTRIASMERGLLLVAAVVSCVAAVVVIPEVRCAVGLKAGTERECALDETGEGSAVIVSAGFYGAPERQPALPLGSLKPSIDRIAKAFDRTEAETEGFRSWHQPVATGLAPDSATATVYANGETIRKIRVRLYNGARKTGLHFYYTGEELDFVFAVVDEMVVPEPRRVDEQRFYFENGRMIRWLDEDRASIVPRSRAFRDNEDRLVEMSAVLLRAARSPGSPIRL